MPDKQQGGVSIIIDGATSFAPRREMTGQEIRDLPTQGVTRDRDLYQEVDGGLDRLIAPGEHVELRAQMRFFTVPRVINPGHRA